MLYPSDSIITAVAERKRFLIQEIRRIKKSLKNAPPGRLRINCVNGHPQYYHRTTPSSHNGAYISRKNYALASRLAQKEYDTKLADAMEKELRAIGSFENQYPTVPAENVYTALSELKQALVTPFEEPLDQFIDRWLALPYEGKEIAEDIPELVTEKGERVRSKSELLISNVLNKEHLPYHYEKPLYLDSFGTVHPDFTILDTRSREEIYWEHMGMMDDLEYMEKALRKISAYIMSGYFPGEKLILTFETRDMPINMPQINALVRHYFL